MARLPVPDIGLCHRALVSTAWTRDGASGASALRRAPAPVDRRQGKIGSWLTIRSYIEANTRERARLRALVEGLDDDTLTAR